MVSGIAGSNVCAQENRKSKTDWKCSRRDCMKKCNGEIFKHLTCGKRKHENEKGESGLNLTISACSLRYISTRYLLFLYFPPNSPPTNEVDDQTENSLEHCLFCSRRAPPPLIQYRLCKHVTLMNCQWLLTLIEPTEWTIHCKMFHE